MTTFREFGGEREDGVVAEAESWWGVFGCDSGGAIVLAKTEEEARVAYAMKCSDDEDDDGVETAQHHLDHGDVFVRRCAVAHAFHNLDETAEPSLEWITGDVIAQAIAAERERAAAELAVLTERMEAAIAEACAAVRTRTIEECAVIAQSASRRAYITSHGKTGADMADAIHTAIRALATPTPAAEPAPVDPAAGALR
jgi:hypothetical protein